jgi:hypothetical protein
MIRKERGKNESEQTHEVGSEVGGGCCSLTGSCIRGSIALGGLSMIDGRTDASGGSIASSAPHNALPFHAMPMLLFPASCEQMQRRHTLLAFCDGIPD